MASDPVAATDWRQLASDLKIPGGMFIGGERRAALDGSTRSVMAARDGSTLVELAWAQPDDADAAVAAAREAFDRGPGVFNVISGDGQVVGRHLGEHPDVDVLTFTGSTEVGRHFMRYSADSNLKRVYLELGGKSPNIIFPNAPDLDASADAAAWAIYFNSGEMCTAGSRLVVHADVADRVVERIVQTAAQWFPADPLLPDTKMGPLVDERSLERVLGYLDHGLAEGASLRVGGHRVLTDTGGAYLEPTVVTGAAADNPLLREEIFGPVLAMQVVSDEAEAVRVAGDTPYGLAAALWTSDLGTAHRVSRALRAGTVWVNCYEEGDMAVPFGGVKLSGFGRDKSRHALDEYTSLKTTWIRYA